MDPTQICTGGGTLCPWGEGSWPFCFGPEKTQKREESGLKNFCIPIFFKVKQVNAPINVNPVGEGGGSAGKGWGFDKF